MPIINIITVSEPELSPVAPFTSTDVTFSCDVAVQRYKANLGGLDYATGINLIDVFENVGTIATKTVGELAAITVADMVRILAPGEEKTESITYDELTTEGANEINFYCQDLNGTWSAFHG